MNILALDISTSCTGWSIFKDKDLLDCGAIQTPTFDAKSPKKFGFKTLFEKMDYVIKELESVCLKHKIDYVVAEAAFKKFAIGKSSADVLAKLIGFNFCLTYSICKKLSCKECFIDVKSARKKVGVKIPKGADAKECVYSFVKDLYPNLSWEVKKTGNPKDWTIDMADSIVIGLASIQLNNFA